MSAINIHEHQFRELLAEGKPLLVDYWAPWCGYCRRIGPAFDQIARQYEGQLEAVKINIDEDAPLAQAENIDVIPTLILYREGKQAASIVAPTSRDAIDAFLRENLGE